MTTVVVPYAGSGGKTRLDSGLRRRLSAAMLEDVVAAARSVGRVIVADQSGGQGPAVAAALSGVEGVVLVVNADLPCATPDDLRALQAATPADGFALVEARDGTTNALGLSSAELFAPVYGPGSAARFRALGGVPVAIPNLVEDVDTADDLERLHPRCGPHTRAILAGVAP
jgi:2-phospho-L-lactate guanylyltransferase (CobY/MobA/RfbA family)